MNILLLGATGRTGKLVLAHALQQGHRVSCLLRNSERLPPQKNLSVFEGDPRNTAQVRKAIQGCQAAISVLNVSRTSDFPWAPLRTPKTFLHDTMATLVPLARKHQLQRMVLCSAWGVGDSRKDLPFWFRWTIDHSNISHAYREHERQEALLRQSGLDHTIVRPVGLTNFNKNLGIQESFANRPKPKVLVSRKAVAQYLVACLKNKEVKNKTVVVSAL
ncbi:NAD(P)-dependent oxidoreductase [Maribacter sp. 2307ULW6-5]|uniref:NAD(P)-dependent oxidoreductase n=1 Tax=Maribacter sp. 2307ULW6-5 TaxID=3386275 RepID=UPI0039BC31D8